MPEQYKNTEKEIRCDECKVLFMGHYARKFCSPECKRKADKKAKAKYNDTVIIVTGKQIGRAHV